MSQKIRFAENVAKWSPYVEINRIIVELDHPQYLICLLIDFPRWQKSGKAAEATAFHFTYGVVFCPADSFIINSSRIYSGIILVGGSFVKVFGTMQQFDFFIATRNRNLKCPIGSKSFLGKN